MSFRRSPWAVAGVTITALLCAGCGLAETGGTSTDGDGSATRNRGGPARVEPVASRGEATPFPGYTLFHPLKSTSVYLVDMDGELVHRWETEYNTGQSVYLLANGNLLRASRDPDPVGPFRGGGEGGIVQEIAGDGTVVWDFKYSDEKRRQHHDIEPMPNGNVLIVAWESRTYEQALQAGINPARMRDDEIWPDFIVEVAPVYPDGGEVVWEWYAWDHLVQEIDPDKDNFGVVADHPELIDINAAPSHRARQQIATPESVDRLRSLGYIAGDAASDDRPEIAADWMHTNSVDYNPQLDQILLSSRHFSEIWIIDHSTTTEEAAGHTGGRYGRGGDLLYRWGNPEAWGSGGPADRTLFVQHDARWIEPGLPGAGNISVFNNGAGRADLNYSSVLEITPPMNPDGSYVMVPGQPTGPATPTWEYVAPVPQDLFSALLSGAQRLPNGNTLIADGLSGRIFEVGAGNAIVWEFTNPFLEDEDRQSTARLLSAFGARTDDGPAAASGGSDDRGGDTGGDERGQGSTHGLPRPGSIYRATRIAPDHPGLRALQRGGEAANRFRRNDSANDRVGRRTEASRQAQASLSANATARPTHRRRSTSSRTPSASTYTIDRKGRPVKSISRQWGSSRAAAAPSLPNRSIRSGPSARSKSGPFGLG